MRALSVCVVSVWLLEWVVFVSFLCCIVCDYDGSSRMYMRLFFFVSLVMRFASVHYVLKCVCVWCGVLV